jgi:hypothetical protein
MVKGVSPSAVTTGVRPQPDRGIADWDAGADFMRELVFN